MQWQWIIGISLWMQPIHTTDNLSIVQQDETRTSVNRAEYKLPALPIVDLDKFDILLDTLDKQTYIKPNNAQIGNDGKIIPEQNGYRLDRLRFTDLFYSYFFGSGPASIAAPRQQIYAKVDSELLANIREKHIGQYTTYYNAGNKNRSHNIILAAKAINNQVVFPGESFSFNRIVGRRDKEKGYLQAPVIVRGELAEDIGGGICQVSSTLFNAVDRAGLKIVQRYSHSRSVPYVLPGRDATVSWGGPDFVFQNPYNQPILIRTYAGGGQMYIAIYSSEVLEFNRRHVPGMSKRLPEEIFIQRDKSHRG